MGTTRKLGVNSMVVTPGGRSIPAKYANIPSVKSTASQSDFNDSFSFDTFANFSNAFNDDLYMAAQMDAIAQAGIAEGAEAEQREELQRKCAENGLVYNADVGDCVSINIDNIISGTLPEDKFDDKDSTLGTNVSIRGTDAIQDYLNQIANDKAFGDLVQSAGIASVIASNNAINTAQNAGFAPVEKAGETVEKIANTELPGILDIPVLGDVIAGGAEGLAELIDKIARTVGLGEWSKDVVVGKGEANVELNPPGQRPQGQSKGGTQVGKAGDTTVTIDTGSPAGNVITRGGTLGDIIDVLDGEGGEGVFTQTDIIMRAACAAQGKEYDENTGMCKQKSSSQPPAGGTTSTGGDNEEASTTVTIGGGTATDPCDDPDYRAANPLECLVVGPNTGDGTPAGGVGPIQQKMCPDGTLVGIDENCPSTTALTKTCPDGKVVDINKDCPGTTTKTCPDGKVVDINEDCPSITTKTCPDGKVVDINEDCPGTTALTKECWDGSVVAMDAKCPDKPSGLDPIPVCGDNTKLAGKPIPADGNCNPVGSTQTQPDCTDPVYAVENPVECGGGGGLNFCDDPDYAAANPEECGGQLNFCDDPDYAAANPEECGGGLTLCGNEIYAMLNPEICSGEVNSGFNMPSGGISRLSTEKSGVADLGVDYDIGGRSIFAPPQAASGGKIENYDLITYLDDILRGR